MTDTHEQQLIARWIAAMNTHDTDTYLSYFTADAVLDDPSVGERFDGHDGIADYFTRYFIGYNTTTRLVRVTARGEELHVDVHFTGDFPGGQTDGVFDVRVTGDRFSFVHADLA
jgi:uncharacterized protein (TIGR02246 family)